MTRAPLQGLVLAGGESRRMGSDKAALELDGVTLLQRAVNLLEPRVDSVYVSVRATDSLRKHFNCISDSIADGGPAAGLLSAHIAHPDKAWLAIACDMPRLSHGLLQNLIAERDPAAGATCWAGTDGKPEPLCAIYEPVTLAAFLQSVTAGGQASPRNWLAERGAKVLQLPESGALRSANTPEEWQELTDKHE